MPADEKKYFPNVKSYTGSHFFPWFSFKGKAILAAAAFMVCIIVQSGIFVYTFFNIKQELNDFDLKSDQVLTIIGSLEEESPDLLNRYQAALLAGTRIEVSDLIHKIDMEIQNLQKLLKNDSDYTHLLSQYQLLNTQLQEYNNIGLTQDQYLEIKQLYSNYSEALLKLAHNQNTYIAGHQFQPFFDHLWLLILSLALLIFLVGFSGYLLLVAIRTITKPANIMTERFRNTKLPIFDINLPITSSEGLGKAGLFFNESLSHLNSVFLNSESSIKVFSALCRELVMEIRKTELFAIQLQEVAEEITSNVNQQDNFLEEANNQLEFLADNSGTLHKVPQKLVLMAEDLKDLLTITENQTREILSKPVEYQDETIEINQLAEQLANTSARISEVVTILKNVAERTELLAFNTAIQAAKAGEKGLGFGVVAKEIAKLVELSRKASLRLNELLEKTQEKNQRVLELISTRTVRLHEEESVFQQAFNICQVMFEIAGRSIQNISQLTKVMEIIFIKSNELSREASLIHTISHTDFNVNANFDVDILDYQLNVKEANRVALKINEMSEELNALTESSASEDLIPF